jgi:Zn-dependent protease with chaperone function
MTTTTMEPAMQNEMSAAKRDFIPVYKHEQALFTLCAVFSGICWLALIVGTLGIGLVYVLFGFVIYLFAHSALISWIRGTGAMLSEGQYPELHKVVRECAARIGMHDMPEVFLLHGDGIFNAFATRFLGRNFVVLYSDIVDALENNPGAVRFYVGHELGHIHRGHLKWMSFLLPARLVPFIGAAYSRACEYTSDRFGHLCCSRPEDSVHALSVLAVGGKKAGSLNVERYLEQVRHSSGFFMSFHEFLSPYPWLVKRIAAVRSYGRGTEPVPPSRSKFAFLFAISGGSGLLVGMVALAVVGVVMATNPKFKKLLNLSKMSSPVMVDPYAGLEDFGMGTELTGTEKARIISDTVSKLATVKSSVAAVARKTRAWPKDNVAAGVKKTDPLYGEHVDYVEIDEGYINVYYKFSSPLIGAVITLTSEFDTAAAEGVSWGCIADSLEQHELPAGCVKEST